MGQCQGPDYPLGERGVHLGVQVFWKRWSGRVRREDSRQQKTQGEVSHLSSGVSQRTCGGVRHVRGRVTRCAHQCTGLWKDGRKLRH